MLHCEVCECLSVHVHVCVYVSACSLHCACCVRDLNVCLDNYMCAYCDTVLIG